MVRHLEHHRELVLATNNLRIPAEIPPGVFHELYVFGGSVRRSAQDTTGPVSFPAPAGGEPMAVRCDVALIAVGGVSAENGFTTNHLDEAAMMRDMMARAATVVVLADSSKFGRDLFAQAAQLSLADVFVSDAAPPAALAAALAEADVQVVIPVERP